jgi:AcrR family transcriptional regulator
MGLREMKARRTRDALHHAVLTLAEERGYDAVTIEMIAERAEVGISTLYRYFPNKDAILLEPVSSNVSTLADALRARPVDEPQDVALGQALRTYFAWTPEDRESVARLRHQLDGAAGPRARLWDLWHQQRLLLEEVLAERANVPVTDLRVAISAQVTMMIVQLTVDWPSTSQPEAPLLDVVDQVIRTFDSDASLVPTLPAG